MKIKILVVDDEISITRMIKINLEMTGKYDVRTENFGRDVLQAVREFQPDLLFLDVMMPDISGDEVFTMLKEDDDLNHTKVVFLTALVTRDETAGGHNKIGGNIFLAKPVKTKDLVHVIDKVLFG